MRCLWKRGEWRLEVLKPQVDDGGDDLVLDANGIVRHVLVRRFERIGDIEGLVNEMFGAQPR